MGKNLPANAGETGSISKFRNKGSQCNEKPAYCSYRVTSARGKKKERKPLDSNEDPEQPKINKMIIFFFFFFILQASVLEWVAIAFSRGSSRPRVK